MNGGDHQRGFALLEVVVVVALVILLFVVAVDRLLPLRGQAEAAHVAQVIGTLRSNLGLAVAERVVTDGLESIDALDGVDPMTLLARPPPNHAGRLSAIGDAEPGTWYFDPHTRRLGYRVRYTGDLAGAPAETRLHWRITVERGNGSPRSVVLRADPGNPRWSMDAADSQQVVRR